MIRNLCPIGHSAAPRRGRDGAWPVPPRPVAGCPVVPPGGRSCPSWPGRMAPHGGLLRHFVAGLDRPPPRGRARRTRTLTFRSVDCVTRTRYQRILLLICPNGTHRCAVGGSIERPCAAKKRPAWKYGDMKLPPRLANWLRARRGVHEEHEAEHLRIMRR
jgi:hypothetical protein